MASPPKKKIIITGFGPFGKYEVNPSAILVPKIKVDELPAEFSHKFDIETKILDVCYEHVDKQFISSDPAHFYIHIGVHPEEKLIRIECQTKSEGYTNKDINGSCPVDHRPCCAPADGEVLKTNLNCEKIAQHVKAFIGDSELRVEVSEDPGSFLCGYTYYCTLKMTSGNSLFVHIPAFDEVATPELLQHVLSEIVEQVLLQCP